MQRFINTRGVPKIISSDNGSNFISNDVQTFAVGQGILWKFNIPEAPWYGGFFERMVQLVKRCLKKILGNARIDYDEMLTVLKQIENVINNRPLTYDYTDDMIEPITPNKLMYGRNLDVVNINGNNYEKIDNTKKRHKYIQSLIDHFWKRWSNEYLVELREHHKKFKNTKCLPAPRLNDVVLIKDDNLKRSDWKMVKITELIRSKDNNIRAAKLDTRSNGKLVHICRPINKLFPLEITEEKVDNVDIKFVNDTDIPRVVVAGGV